MSILDSIDASLNNLLRDIQKGNIQLHDFQRGAIEKLRAISWDSSEVPA